MTLKIHGTGCSTAPSSHWLVTFDCMCLMLRGHAGIQTYIHVAQFRYQRTQGYPFQQCADSWYDSSHTCVDCLHCNPSKFSHVSILLSNGPSRFALRSHHHLCSPELTLVQTLKPSITPYWTYFMMSTKRMKLMLFLHGGTSMNKCLCNLIYLTNCNISQIFPNYSLSRPAPYNNSPLAKIKQKWTERLLLNEVYNEADDEAEVNESEVDN